MSHVTVPAWKIRRMSTCPLMELGNSQNKGKYKIPFREVYSKTITHWLAMCVQCHVVARLLKYAKE